MCFIHLPDLLHWDSNTITYYLLAAVLSLSHVPTPCHKGFEILVSVSGWRQIDTHLQYEERVSAHCTFKIRKSTCRSPSATKWHYLCPRKCCKTQVKKELNKWWLRAQIPEAVLHLPSSLAIQLNNLITKYHHCRIKIGIFLTTSLLFRGTFMVFKSL